MAAPDASITVLTMRASGSDLEARAVAAVLADPVCHVLLSRLPLLGLTDWWLTAGAVFQNIWNAVEGHPAGHGVKDYDVFYFDGSDLTWEAEDRIIRASGELFDDLGAQVELRNEARVHLWYQAKFGVAATPFTSARDAIDAFASTTCCVGVTRGPESLEIYAPFGLQDVFAMHLRPNHRLAPQDVYEAKVEQYLSRWPSLTHAPW